MDQSFLLLMLLSLNSSSAKWPEFSLLFNLYSYKLGFTLLVLFVYYCLKISLAWIFSSLDFRENLKISGYYFDITLLEYVSKSERKFSSFKAELLNETISLDYVWFIFTCLFAKGVLPDETFLWWFVTTGLLWSKFIDFGR